MPALHDFIDRLKRSGGTAHLMGLLSPGGVHSHQHQIAALARIVAEAGVPVAVHAFLDGRDTPPQAALSYLEKFEADVAGLGNLVVATVSGRYFAMDRDKRWDRVERAYRVLVDGKGETAATAAAAIEAAYQRGETDEFVLPTAIGGYRGMQDGDGLLIGNFRADRVREIATALLDPAFRRVYPRPGGSALPPPSAWSNIRISSTGFSARCSRRKISTTLLARSSRAPA